MVKLGKLALVALLTVIFGMVSAYAAPVQDSPATQKPSGTQEAQAAPQERLDLLKVKYSENNSEAFIPQIKGMKDTALENTINNNLKTSIIPPNASLRGNFEVTLYNENLLGIHFRGVTSSSKEADPKNIDKSIHIDLTTGKIYKLEDLFKPVDFENIIKKICLANDSKLRITNKDQSNQWTYKDFANAWNKENGPFALLADSLIVYSAQSERIIGYKIPYSDLKNIINTNGELWNRIQEQKTQN